MTEGAFGGRPTDDPQANDNARPVADTPSSPRSFALGYLSDISGFKNPQDHTAEWFERAMNTARAEERERCEKAAIWAIHDASIPADGLNLRRREIIARAVVAAIRTENIGESEERTTHA